MRRPQKVYYRNSVYKKVRLLDVSVRGHACLQSGSEVRGNSETLTATASKSNKKRGQLPWWVLDGIDGFSVFPVVFPRGVMVFPGVSRMKPTKVVPPGHWHLQG